MQSYEMNMQDNLFGIMYQHSIDTIPSFQYYNTDEKRNEEFENILNTKQVYEPWSGRIVYPIRLCKVDKHIGLYSMPIKQVVTHEKE